MMCAVRGPVSLLAALGTALAATLLGPAIAGASVAATGGAQRTQGSAAVVRTVVGPGVLDAPAGLALDGSGDLFVADSGHCRVAVVPVHDGTLDGLHLHPGRVTTLVGGSCRGSASIGHPSGVAVDTRGDVFVAEATAHRVQVVRAGARPAAVTVAGTGKPGSSPSGQLATDSSLDRPTSVAVDGAGNLYIADSANCVVLVDPARDATLFGVAMAAGDLYTVAGTRVCGTTGQGGPLRTAELWNPVAVAIDVSGNLLVADAGDQSVLVAPARAGTFYGTPIAAGDIAVVAGGTGSYGPYLVDGLSAKGPTAELNDPRGLAVGAGGELVVTDGFMHAVRMVPSTDGTLFGQAVKAGDMYTVLGAVPVSASSGAGNATRWIRAHAATPAGIAVSAAGAVVVGDASLGTVSELAGS
jgi:sugar lactone lactonase YvrE